MNEKSPKTNRSKREEIHEIEVIEEDTLLEHMKKTEDCDCEDCKFNWSGYPDER